MQEKAEAKTWYSLYGQLLCEKRLQAAFAKVRKAKGAPGIDGQSTADFTKEEAHNLALLLRELKEKSYCPLPVRRKVIPKSDGGERMLGIPAVRDRVVQQALLDILQPVFASAALRSLPSHLISILRAMPIGRDGAVTKP